MGASDELIFGIDKPPPKPRQGGEAVSAGLRRAVGLGKNPAAARRFQSIQPSCPFIVLFRLPFRCVGEKKKG